MLTANLRRVLADLDDDEAARLVALFDQLLAAQRTWPIDEATKHAIRGAANLALRRVQADGPGSLTPDPGDVGRYLSEVAACATVQGYLLGRLEAAREAATEARGH